MKQSQIQQQASLICQDIFGAVVRSDDKNLWKKALKSTEKHIRKLQFEINSMCQDNPNETNEKLENLYVWSEARKMLITKFGQKFIKTKTMQISLFGENTVDKFSKNYRSDVISALHKNLRLGNVERSLILTAQAIHNGISKSYLARRLLIAVFEDCDDEQLFAFASAVFGAVEASSIGWTRTNGGWERSYSQPDTNAIYMAVYRICKAKKIWETERGKHYLQLLYQAESQAKQAPLPFFAYELDEHSATGKEWKKSGKELETRFSGSFIGNFQRITEYDLFGEIKVDRKAKEVKQIKTQAEKIMLDLCKK